MYTIINLKNFCEVDVTRGTKEEMEKKLEHLQRLYPEAKDCIVIEVA